MAADVVINVKVNDAELQSLENELDGVASSLNRVESNAKGASDSVEEVAKNGGAIATLDRLTGGVASQIRDAWEATKLFNVSLKGLRTALIATGIGALVVAVGLLVTYWEEITNFITGANKSLEGQLNIIKEQNGQLDARLAQLESIAKLNGETVANNKELLKQQKELLKQKAAQQVIEISLLQQQLLQEKSAARRATLLEQILRGGRGGSLGAVTEEEQAALGALETRLIQAQNAYIDTINLINGSETTSTDGKKSINTTQSRDKIEGQDLFVEGSSTPALLDAAIERSNAILDVERNAALESVRISTQAQIDRTAAEQKETDERLRIAQLEANAKQELFFLVSDAAAVASELAGKETAAGKALAIASTLISTYLSAQQAYASQFLPIPTASSPIRAALAASVAVAAGLANVKAILSTKVPGEGGVSVPGGTGGAQAPAFNVVGTSGANQIAQGLTQQDEPIQAFVVGSNVTSQQALDRNIVETATIG